ncbi:MAG: ribosome-associated translation inhibitor RaiA [Deltaproteobacteria bacterium]|nr:ribosome-associated translation inhibitor RaiA [Deltaproteobacteria bacterium]
MHITVTFRHMDSSDALRVYAEEKTERFQKYLSEPIEVHWVLSVEKIRHMADATIAGSGVTIKAAEATGDMYSAIDAVLDKLEQQVRKHKEKIKDHKPHTDEPAGKRFTQTAGSASQASPLKGPSPRIVKKENQFLKPMSVDEAAMQMDIGKNGFLVFTDSATSNVSVIYRTEGGDYGLIESRAK